MFGGNSFRIASFYFCYKFFSTDLMWITWISKVFLYLQKIIVNDEILINLMFIAKTDV